MIGLENRKNEIRPKNMLDCLFLDRLLDFERKQMVTCGREKNAFANFSLPLYDKQIRNGDLNGRCTDLPDNRETLNR